MMPAGFGAIGGGQGSSVNPDLSAKSGNGDFAGGGIGSNTFNFTPPPVSLGGVSVGTSQLLIGGLVVLGVFALMKKRK